MAGASSRSRCKAGHDTGVHASCHDRVPGLEDKTNQGRRFRKMLLRLSVLWQKEGHPMKTSEQYRPPAAAHSCPGIRTVLQRRTGPSAPEMKSTDIEVAVARPETRSTRRPESFYRPHTFWDRRTALLKTKHAQGRTRPRAMERSTSDADIGYLPTHNFGKFLCPAL